ncbi:S8 family peptidase [Clostridium tarantellae]|uniref:S8 family serine peptidase n=1 Tax=Clostridium tarantellae TaxID=39493 RepID=A0A6I1MY82_9CLOT|nr:S8 family peptidase [Clostridium tarantellae]MPQ45089.1 S8 family serine peptidase [Clostridium tarantellae]
MDKDIHKTPFKTDIYEEKAPWINGFVTLLIEYTGDIINALKNKNAEVFILNDLYATLSSSLEEVDTIINTTDEIVYVDPGGIYTLNASSPIEESGAIDLINNPYLKLNGEGVLMGLIDTGIDYLNTQFINEDGTTRILKIFDQTVQTGKQPKGFGFGSEYTEDDINKAIKENLNGGNPYDIVPSKDIIGHGTSMANLIGGYGKDFSLNGVATKSNFVVVKLHEANDGVLKYFSVNEELLEKKFSNVAIIMALKYLHEIFIELKRPMVVYLPLGTTIGSHDGNSLMEKYIDNLSSFRGFIVTTTTGNEGNTQNHTSGIFKKEGKSGNIELLVGEGQEKLQFEIWIDTPNKCALSISSPTGELFENIKPKFKQEVKLKFFYEGTEIIIKNFIPEETTGDQRILIKCENIIAGIWQFNLTSNSIVLGKYHVWLPQRQLLASDTKFLKSNPECTLVIPSTSRRIISTGFYNQNNNAIISESGRGFTRDKRTKPDIVTGGFGAKTITSNNEIVHITSACVAGAVLTGCCALILQWGIVNGKDKALYSPKVKSYLIRGANRRIGEPYPNAQSGYGFLNIVKTFDNIRSLDDKITHIEYNIKSLFVSIPSDYYFSIDF